MVALFFLIGFTLGLFVGGLPRRPTSTFRCVEAGDTYCTHTGRHDWEPDA